MKLKGIRHLVKRTGFYIPFTLYFLLLGVAAVVCFFIFQQAKYQAESSFADIFLLLVKVASWFAFTFIALACITVLLSYLHFLYYKRKAGITFSIATDLQQSELHNKQTVRLLLKPVFKPLFGFLKLRLKYDSANYSTKFSLVEYGKKSFFSNEVRGIYHWPLPQIKEYHVEKAILYFEDVFQFFSIAVDLPANNNFFTQPTTNSASELNVSPRRTEDTTTRIEELRRVDGEYLNYKNFEANDDVRRIVWKIYAKNKELVVRVPEIIDPYASHVYLYVSFFTSMDIEGNTVAEVPFLNYYKIISWNIYQSLVKQGFDVKYIADQQVAQGGTNDEQQSIKYSISTSSWHREKDLSSYVNTKDAAVVLISSLSNPNHVEELVERYGNEIKFVFVKLTDSLKKQDAFDWVQWVFIRNQENDIETYKRIWSLSLLRARVVANEKKIEQILNKYEVAVV